MARLARHRNVQLIWLVLLLVLCQPFSSFAKDAATVVRAVDGDTLEVALNGRHEKVRLIGVDTPEVFESQKLHRDVARTHQDEKTIQALGKRASEFTKSLVHTGDQVELEYGQEPRDKYHRVLAFVWLADGRLLNEVIICEGFGNALTRYPFRTDYMERFRACERQAREGEKGLWGAGLAAQEPGSVSASQPTSVQSGDIHGNRRSMIYHLPTCPDYGRISPKNVVPFKSEEEASKAGYRKAKNCP